MNRLLATALVGIGIGVAGTKGTDAIMESATTADSSYSLDQHEYISVVPDSLCSRVDTAHADNIIHQHPLSDYTVKGDVTYDGKVTIADATFIIGFLFRGQTLPVKPAN